MRILMLKHLTLHSNMFLLIRLGYRMLSQKSRIFTFQYVSINTLTEDKSDEYVVFFTFQYVSINTPAPLNHRLILPYYTIFCRPWYFLSFYLFRYNTVHRKHYFAYVFHVCRPLVILSLSQVDNHKMKLVRSSFLPQNSLSIHFS